MILGLRSVIYNVSDLDRAKAWYAKVSRFKPYFDEAFYVGFNVGGYELGLHPGSPGGSGVVAYWGVDNADAALKRLLELGASKHEDVQDLGDGIKVATVIDPLGNIFGVIENPHFSPESK